MFDERTGAGTSPLAYEQQAVVRTLRRMMSADRSLHADGPRRALLDVLAAWSSAAETMLPVFGRFVLKIVQPAGPEPLTNEAIFDEVRGLCERHAFVLPFTPKLYRIRDAIVHERFSEGEQEITFYDGRSRVIASLPLLDAIHTAQRDICAAAVFPPAVLSTEVEHDNLVGKFDVLWERAQACIPDLVDRVRDCGEPWIPSNWELVDISPKEADTWNPTPHESLSRMLTSLFSDQELRIFLGCFPAGPDLLVELPGAGATPAYLAAETVQLLERRRLTPLLFRRLMRSFPRRQAEIKEIQRLFGPWRASPVSSG